MSTIKSILATGLGIAGAVGASVLFPEAPIIAGALGAVSFVGGYHAVDDVVQIGKRVVNDIENSGSNKITNIKKDDNKNNVSGNIYSQLPISLPLTSSGFKTSYDLSEATNHTLMPQNLSGMAKFDANKSNNINEEIKSAMPKVKQNSVNIEKEKIKNLNKEKNKNINASRLGISQIPLNRNQIKKTI